MFRVFLDANVLFSAAWREDSVLLRLWKRKDIILVTSAYALEEARRNLKKEECLIRLDRLVEAVEVLFFQPEVELPTSIDLPDKDRPILQAAIYANCQYLLTGDLRDFGPWFGNKAAGVIIMAPNDFLELKLR